MARFIAHNCHVQMKCTVHTLICETSQKTKEKTNIFCIHFENENKQAESCMHEKANNRLAAQQDCST